VSIPILDAKHWYLHVKVATGLFINKLSRPNEHAARLRLLQSAVELFPERSAFSSLDTSLERQEGRKEKRHKSGQRG